MSKFLIYFLLPISMIFACGSKTNEPEGSKISVKEGLAVGDRAPEISYPNPEGEMVSLSSLRGKLVLIDFWASWCPPYRRENPGLVNTYKEFKDKKFIRGAGFTVYSISYDKTHNA